MNGEKEILSVTAWQNLLYEIRRLAERYSAENVKEAVDYVQGESQ